MVSGFLYRDNQGLVSSNFAVQAPAFASGSIELSRVPTIEQPRRLTGLASCPAVASCAHQLSGSNSRREQVSWVNRTRIREAWASTWDRGSRTARG